MSTGERRQLDSARRDAEAFRDLFSGCFDQWTIAGSIRRKKPDVGDVEHVVIPKMRKLTSGLFGEPSEQNALLVRLDEEVEALSGPIAKAVYPDMRHRWGEKYRGVVFNGFRHEVFIADEQNWGSILAIRTGPADYSRMLVTKLLDARRYRQQDGYVRYASDGAIRAVPTEEEFFRLCGVEYVAPEERTSRTLGQRRTQSDRP